MRRIPRYRRAWMTSLVPTSAQSHLETVRRWRGGRRWRRQNRRGMAMPRAVGFALRSSRAASDRVRRATSAAATCRMRPAPARQPGGSCRGFHVLDGARRRPFPRQQLVQLMVLGSARRRVGSCSTSVSQVSGWSAVQSRGGEQRGEDGPIARLPPSSDRLKKPCLPWAIVSIGCLREPSWQSTSTRPALRNIVRPCQCPRV